MAYQEFDPFADRPDDAMTAQGVVTLAEFGWEDFFDLGDDAEITLYVRTYRRTQGGRTQYLVTVSDANFVSPYVKVDTFPELMDLLARWAPAIQAASVTSLLTDVRQYGLSSDGAIEAIAAKAAYGGRQGLEKLERHEQEQSQFRRREAARRNAERVAHVPTNEVVDYPGDDPQ